MKKVFLSAILLIAVIVISNAQKVDLDRFYFKATVRNLPLKPLGFEYKTFDAQAFFTSGVGKLFTAEEVVNNFTIDGFQQTAESPDLTIKFNSEDIQLYRTEVKNRVVEEKDKNGNVKSRKTFYWFEIEYSMSVKYELFDNKKNVSVTTARVDGRDNKYIFKSSETSTHAGARDFYFLNKEMVIRDIMAARFNDYYKSISSSLTTNYGYRISTETELLWILGAKKHADFEEYNKMYTVINDAFAQMSSDATVEPVAEAVKPAIEYLNGIITRYTADEKNDKKMRYSAYYNLAKIYLYLDMPDEVIKMGNLIITNDYDSGDGKRLIDEASKLKDLLAKNNLTTRHFPR